MDIAGIQAEKGRAQAVWLLAALEAFHALEQESEAQEALSSLEAQLEGISSKEELRNFMHILNNTLAPYSHFPSCELVETGREESGVLSQIEFFEKFLNAACEASLLDKNKESSLWAQTAKLWNAVESRSISDPLEAIPHLSGIIKQTNKALPEGHHFPEPPLRGY